MDLNGFKLTNDQYGHDVGDRCLRHFSQILKDSFSRHWLICRYGGDEFLLFRQLDSAQELDDALEQFNRNLDLFNSERNLPFALGMSVGVCMAEEGKGGDAACFLKCLDERMYQNKEQMQTVSQDLFG